MVYKEWDEVVSVRTSKIEMEEVKEVRCVYVGYEMWQRLGIGKILKGCGFNRNREILICGMVLNRLIASGSERAMADWFRRVAIEDILKMLCKGIAEDRLYSMLDRLHPNREKIEGLLTKQERCLFNLNKTVLFYNLTSTYFEGNAKCNEKAQKGYSRDGRSDCKQVVVGLVIGEEGFKDIDYKKGWVIYILCESDARCQKDRAIRERFEGMLLKEVEKLRKRIRGGRIKGEGEIQQAIGRLKERYSRVARHYRLEYLSDSKTIVCSLVGDKKKRAEDIDGCYILKTDRSDMDAEEIWRTYMMPTRAESGFRAMKSPLAERPIFHQLQHRVETHIFLCILAYHLLVAIEKTLRDHG